MDPETRMLVGEIIEAFRTFGCPCPVSGRPDDFTVGECIDAGECACCAGLTISGYLKNQEPDE